MEIIISHDNTEWRSIRRQVPFSTRSVHGIGMLGLLCMFSGLLICRGSTRCTLMNAHGCVKNVL